MMTRRIKIVLYSNDTRIKTSEKGIHTRAIGGRNTDSEKRRMEKKKLRRKKKKRLM
jgi:hypothetical protein